MLIWGMGGGAVGAGGGIAVDNVLFNKFRQ